jgi:hypothetical protein
VEQNIKSTFWKSGAKYKIKGLNRFGSTFSKG